MLIYEGGEIIRRYPFVKQRGIRDCGPACIQMILRYYHGYVSLDKLSEMANTTKEGTTAYNLKETLETLGFYSYGLKSEDIHELKLPCIAHVIINNSYRHYIVIYKVNLKKEKLLIADPAFGLKQITFEEFKQIWSGVSIHMYPNAHIVYEPKPKALKFIWYYIKKHVHLVILIQFVSLIFHLFNILSNLFIPLTISLYGNWNKLYLIIKIFLVIYAIKNLFLFIKNKLILKLNLDLDQELQVDVFEKVLNLPYRYYRRKTTGEITSYFNDLYIIRNGVINFVQISFIELFLIIILIILIFNINSLVLLILLILLFLNFVVIFIYQKKKDIWLSENIRHKALINSYITESITGFETIKNLNITYKIYNKFKDKYQMFLNTAKRLFAFEMKFDFFKNFSNDFSAFFIILVLLLLKINMHDFIILFLLSLMLFSSFENILNFYFQMNEVRSALINIVELISKKSENLNLTLASGNIVIKNLNYTYDKINYVLKNVNLVIDKASKVMVTGDSGSGKSTLFKIIKGYYNEYKGSIKIGNLELNKNHFDNIIYVSQKEFLFTGSLKDNLNLKEENSKCIKICEIDDFASNDYYDLIEEDGFNISGGQRQRIVLARALNGFDILIIDEGLNQVSVDMERRILKKLFNAYIDKTIICISHRLDNLDLFDQYIKMNDGEVVINTKRNN